MLLLKIGNNQEIKRIANPGLKSSLEIEKKI